MPGWWRSTWSAESSAVLHTWLDPPLHATRYTLVPSAVPFAVRHPVVPDGAVTHACHTWFGPLVRFQTCTMAPLALLLFRSSRYRPIWVSRMVPEWTVARLRPSR